MKNPYENEHDVNNNDFGFSLCRDDVKNDFLNGIKNISGKPISNELKEYIDTMFSSNCFFVSKTEVNHHNEVIALEKDQESIFNDTKFVKWFMEQKDD